MSENNKASFKGPLVVDLDGSLIKTELPWESFLSVLIKHPVELFNIIKRKIKIKEEGYLKIELEKWAELSLEKMPFSKTFLNYLKEEKERGRKLILCTGSTQAYAERIQQITGLFDSVYGSTLGKNLAGRKKAMFLVGKYGEKQFDYAGNSFADLKVAQHARHFILVNPSFLTLFFSKKIKVYRRFMKKEINPSFFAHTLGFHLWFLNCIMFILLFLVPSYFEYLFFALAFSVVHFNFTATTFHVFFSMIYAQQDRESLPKSTNNLFATGDLSLPFGFFLFCSCFFLSFISLIYLLWRQPLSLISSLLYTFCIYLLVHKKIKNLQISSAIRYTLTVVAVLLQGLFIAG